VLVVSAAAQVAEPSPKVEAHLAGPLHRLLCNDVVMVASLGKDGILLVDTGFPATADVVRTALGQLGNGPVRIIVNTHGDFDHVGGNAVLGSAAMIFAHLAVYQQMGTYFALPRLETAGLPTDHRQRGGTGPAPTSVCKPVSEALVREGIAPAVDLYRRLRKEEPEQWSFAENELNMLGYQLLQRSMIAEAIAVFQLNVEAFPEAFNTHDSLGEAYMAAGQNELAIASYQRSLELNPDNTNAVAMLQRLRGE